jgi:hypothetical protein
MARYEPGLSRTDFGTFLTSFTDVKLQPAYALAPTSNTTAIP